MSRPVLPFRGVVGCCFVAVVVSGVVESMVWGVLVIVRVVVVFQAVKVLVVVLLAPVVVRDHVRSQSPGHRVVACRHRYRSLLQTRGSGLLDDLYC